MPSDLEWVLCQQAPAGYCLACAVGDCEACSADDHTDPCLCPCNQPDQPSLTELRGRNP